MQRLSMKLLILKQSKKKETQCGYSNCVSFCHILNYPTIRYFFSTLFRTSCPSSVTRTRSSTRTPYLPSIQIPGSMEKIIPGSATFLLIGLTSPYSWSYCPMKCPRRIFQYSLQPFSSMQSLACASISQKRAPGLIAASAFSTAVRTIS